MRHLIFGLWMAGCGIGVASAVMGFAPLRLVWVVWAGVFIPILTVNIVRWFMYDRGKEPAWITEFNRRND